MKSLLKNLFKPIYFLFRVLAFITLFLFLTENEHIIKGIKETYLKGSNTSKIEDWRAFNNNVILKSKKAKNFEKNKNYKFSPTEELEKKLIKEKTTSFIVLKDNELLYEKYFENSTKNSISNSFSMAKALGVLLVGFAIEEGYIKNLDQNVLDFLPEYKNVKFAKNLKIKHLVEMSSGLNWIENYKNPFKSTVAKAYYGDNLEKLMFSLDFVKEPGTEFKYSSGDSQLLSIILKRATKKSLAEYLQEKIWEPLEMTNSALWGLDRENGMEKGFCCIYSTATDFAKLGQFLLQGGIWNGKRLLNINFINKMIHPNGLTKEYGRGLWMDYEYQNPFFSYVGHLGQYILIIPNEKIVIVRLGKKNDNTIRKGKKHLREEMYFYVDEVLKTIKTNE